MRPTLSESFGRPRGSRFIFKSSGIVPITPPEKITLSASIVPAPALVFVSSASAELGLPGQAAYTASKAGIVGLAQTLAAEWGPLGIRVNVVMPGLIGTPKVRALPDALLGAMTRSIPLGRVGEPADVAATIAFLLGPGAAYVHGQVLRIDGGLGLTTASLATGERS
jgi:NAD(P)-dependent dehydrogenase (short-subunit alcohol dehydrogenase family)